MQGDAADGDNEASDALLASACETGNSAIAIPGLTSSPDTHERARPIHVSSSNSDSRWASPVGDVESKGQEGRLSKLDSLRPNNIKTHHDVRREQIRDIIESGLHLQHREQPVEKLQRILGSPVEGFWIESEKAKLLIILCILLHAGFVVLFVVLNLDGNSLEIRSNLWLHFIVTSVYIVFFFFELVLRLRSALSRTLFLQDRWNRYDIVLLSTMVVNTFILFFIKEVRLVFLTLLMVAPVFQVLRIGRFEEELQLIMLGMMRALRAVVWAITLFTLLVYACGVLCTYFLSKTSYFKEDPTTQKLFGGLGDSMFTLFSFATLEDYTGYLRHYMHFGRAGPLFAMCIIAFILFANLALLNLVTALVVDSIIDVLPKKRTEMLLKERAATIARLHRLFHELDADADNKLTLKEFQNGVENDDAVKKEMTRLQLTAFDVKELFALIDRSESGRVNVEDFVEGLLRMMPGEASRKELLGVQADVHKMWQTLAIGQERLEGKMEDFMGSRLSGIERSMGLLFEQVETLLEGKINDLQQRAQSEWQSFGTSLIASKLNVLVDELEIMRPAMLDAVASSEGRLAALVQELLPNARSLVSLGTSPRASQSPRLIMEARDLPNTSPTPQSISQSGSRAAAALASTSASAVPPDVGSGLTTEEEPEPHFQSPLPRERGQRRLSPSSASAFGASRVPRRLASLEAAMTAHQQSRASSASRIPRRLSSLEVAMTGQQQQIQGEHRAASWPPQQTSVPVQRQLHSRSVERPFAVMDARSSTEDDTYVSNRLARPFSICLGNLIGPPHSFGDVATRVQQASMWLSQQGWASSMPFDKIILHLDALGVELSVTEQDMLKRAVRPEIF